MTSKMIGAILKTIEAFQLTKMYFLGACEYADREWWHALPINPWCKGCTQVFILRCGIQSRFIQRAAVFASAFCRAHGGRIKLRCKCPEIAGHFRMMYSSPPHWMKSEVFSMWNQSWSSFVPNARRPRLRRKSTQLWLKLVCALPSSMQTGSSKPWGCIGEIMTTAAQGYVSSKMLGKI